ncbi:alpha/beta hydrolase domain-containing protein [Algiphilus aromaticivorans]|jgi:hypothetical protein|uniref:alpha/beta hydrolase domain-containing protein n=1 Tax=Algiphilus aromaticivorans TaxID=382454 RepID=UPI0005C2633F|nr:alpha/beta hydrolase domain-containing protein [Algiphilus aromaticivorans]
MSPARPYPIFPLALVALLLAACSGSEPPAESAEIRADAVTVEGPITGGLRGHALWDSWFDLGDLGYEEAEYFVSGQAQSADGATTAPYTTRFLLRRPQRAEDFNGTVVLDWVNVTAQFENPVVLLNAQQHLLREGYAFAHVSVQEAGLCCLPLLTPKTWDPVRYAPLDHPGDEYAFTMLNQIAGAIRGDGGENDPMAGQPVEKLLVAGQSQSANQLFDFASGDHVDGEVIDGLLIQSPIGRVFEAPPPVPVLQLLSDYEAQPEAADFRDNLVLWEVAGSAHQDFHVGYQQVFGQALRAEASLPKRPAQAYFRLLETAGNYGERPHPLHAACILAGAAFPMRYAVNAALHHLDGWVRGGARPPEAPRYTFDADGALARDRFGNAQGGIRLPPVEVPVARYRSTDCGLGGTTVPFSRQRLNQEYASHAEYFCALQAAAALSVADGFLLPADTEDLMGRARAMRSRFAVEGTIDCD